MQLKHKFIVLTVAPLLVAIAAVAGIVAYQTRLLAREQAQIIEARFLASKRAELQHYVGLAMSSIGHIYGSGRTDEAAKQQARVILSEMNYGDDGYFFAYDMAGNNVVHPRKPELVGRNLWNLKDPEGKLVIQSLLRAARDGDGFERYQWEKPSTRQMTEKLGHVVMLERWGWMLGTGIYLDDLEQTMLTARNEVSESIRATMAAIAGVAVVAALLVFAGGLALNVSEHRLADAKLKQLAQDIVRLQEVERARVSRELTTESASCSSRSSSISSWRWKNCGRAAAIRGRMLRRASAGWPMRSPRYAGYPTTCVRRCLTTWAWQRRSSNWGAISRRGPASAPKRMPSATDRRPAAMPR